MPAHEKCSWHTWRTGIETCTINETLSIRCRLGRWTVRVLANVRGPMIGMVRCIARREK